MNAVNKVNSNIVLMNVVNKVNSNIVLINVKEMDFVSLTKPAFTCSKLTIETLEQGVKYVQI